jgi:hypothetical protein
MKAAFPLEIKRGNASVKIYKRFKNGYEEFRIAYYDLDGRRKLRSFSSLQAAKDEAAVKATSISTGDFTGLSLSGEDRLAIPLKPSARQEARPNVSARHLDFCHFDVFFASQFAFGVVPVSWRSSITPHEI